MEKVEVITEPIVEVVSEELTTVTKTVLFSQIKTNDEHLLNRQVVEGLAKSIDKIGLLHSLLVDPNLEIIAGRHRYAALKIIYANEPSGLVHVKVVHASRQIMERMRVSENRCRRVNTPLWVAESVKEYFEAACQTYGAEAKELGIKPKGIKERVFEDLREMLSVKDRDIENKIKIASMSEEVKSKIRDTPVEHMKSKLIKLAYIKTEEDQFAYIDKLLQKKKKSEDIQSKIESLTKKVKSIKEGVTKMRSSISKIDGASEFLSEFNEFEAIIDRLVQTTSKLSEVSLSERFDH